MSRKTIIIPHLDWLNPLKGLALLAILLNHLVEEFGPGPWFTNPFNNWPDLATRMANVFPKDHSLPVSIIQFLGWLGDSGPGVFILASGIGLTWAALHRPKNDLKFVNFFRRRAIRIYPLYIAMHFIFLAGAVFIPDSVISKVSPFSYTLDSPYTILSMLGLRCTDSLFFGFISPAWWFVWLIIQLYLLFPFLYLLMKRIGLKWFLILTCTFTFASRFFAVLNPDWLPYSLFNWMTGIFFGTRLAEFCIGMAIAVILFRLKGRNQQQPGVERVFAWALPIYLLGLTCSFTWVGSVVSNLLVTLGMAGLFYSMWATFIKKVPILSQGLVWIGVEAYSIYLVHQPPLKLTSVLISGVEWHLAAAVIVLAVSFPAGWLINQAVKKLILMGKHMTTRESFRTFSFLVAVGLGLALVFIDPPTGWKSRFFSLIIGLTLIFLIFAESAFSMRKNRPEQLFFWTIISASLLKLLFFPSRLGTFIALTLAGVLAFSAKILCRYFKSPILALSATLTGWTLIILTLELTLWHLAPLEVGKWGELPALQRHPTRIFSLKANIEKRLRYNNYDYIIRTNSLGLASPEINLSIRTPSTFRILVLGDAFSMPEGIEYEYSYPALLEKRIAEGFSNRPVQVINAGVTGYGPVEQCPQLRELGPIFKPDVVIYQFFVNEFSDVNATAQRLLDNIGLTLGNESMRCDYAERSQIIRHAVNCIYELVEHLLRAYGEKSLIIRHVGNRMYSLIEKATGRWRYNKSLLQFYRSGDNSLYSQQTIKKLSFYIDTMNRLCRDIGAKFVIFFVPGAVAVSKPHDIAYFPLDEDLTNQSIYDFERPFINLKKIADSLRVPVVDLTPYLKEHPKQPVYFPKSWHWNKEGHRAVVNAIANNLDRSGWLDLGRRHSLDKIDG